MFEDRIVTAVIVAAGSGTRMGGVLPKQFLKIGGRTILEMAARPFEKSQYVDNILVMTSQDFVALCEDICRRFAKVSAVLPGGRERQDTVNAAMKHVPDGQLVLIHDGARPYVTERVIENVLRCAKSTGAAAAAVPCKDTIRQADRQAGGQAARKTDGKPDGQAARKTDGKPDGQAEGKTGLREAPVPRSHTLDRSTLFQVQTPQGFHSELLRKAIVRAAEEGLRGTDDASLVEWLGYPVALAEGDYANIKITTREDLPMEIRTGTGFDVHQLTEGRKLILGGVEIPCEKGLLGHSDADVMVHALMDAMLGAAALGDIGRLFPDGDPAYEGVSSLKLLEEVNRRIEEEGYVLGNADITIIAQKPKLAGYIGRMEENLSDALHIEAGRINVKATTTEKLGFTGRGEGIAAEAVCTLTRKQ